ncbi:glycine/betaine ABC transporter substrate-binding protein [Streptomyces sp. RKND-216]|uniref:ABC transporter substrate-binding protein n=1 Tax=Streptomyces sp. RKND-216 TaxID=2562581 RepID=UPI00109DB2AC|nr:ABC transporter substrate-binding protein [Streptomyces sp. RKND-216]THA24877.1 glycine/betaine ABC transporter substrate-binding protein [Streptomyces sp. RKND-216]
MKNSKRIRTTVLAGTAVVGMLGMSACAAKTDTSGGGGESVTLAQPSWVGAQANVAVAAKLLEDEMGYDVEVKQLDEPAAFDALHSGNVDALLEDWGGVPKKEKLYVEEKKTVVNGGDLGVEGHIGWFVPKYYADKHPEVKNWKGLKKLWQDFKTSESGGKGQFLGAAPSYTTHDKELINSLDLNFKIVPTGSEAAELKEIKRLYDAKKPFVGYWWQPQWMNAEIEMVEVELPPYEDGCLEAKPIKCGYDTLMLQKYFNADFEKDGGEAAQFLKNFAWETEDQNKVAQMIAGEGMDQEDAAAEWIKSNKSTWEQWIPKK